MGFLLGLVGAFVGIFLALTVIFLIVYYKFRHSMKKLGLNNVNTLSDMKREMEKIKADDSNRVRSISGMTNLLLPRIRKDFPDFNEQELFNKTEAGLRKIFTAIENKTTEEIEDLNLLKESLKQVIDDYKNDNVEVRFTDATFHKYSIYHYAKDNGVATITISVALAYYYTKRKDDKIIENFTDYKRQTTYRCNFIYVYDINKVKDSEKVLAVNCPNCGAVIKALGHKQCEYCGAGIQEINLRSWEMSSYEEF